MAVRNGGMTTVQGFLEPVGYTQITDVSSAVGVGTIPVGTKLAMIQPTAQNVRWRDDGSSPTATVGMLLVANDMLVYSGPLASIKFFEAAGGAKLNISFYK